MNTNLIKSLEDIDKAINDLMTKYGEPGVTRRLRRGKSLSMTV